MAELRPYQVEGARFLQDTGRAFLCDEPGVGKTAQLLAAAEGRTLILAPAMLHDVWHEEIQKWDLDVAFAHWTSYSGVCRRVATKTGQNGQPVYEVVAALREGLEAQWDTIICDEAHYLKGRKTLWSQVVAAKLRSDRLFLATGTPLPNWGHELFQLLRIMYPGDKRFTNYWQWIDEYFKTWNPPYAPKSTKILGLHKGTEWQDVAREWGVADRWLRRSLDDVLPELPPMTRQTIRVPMTQEQAIVYDRLEEDWFATLPDTGEQVVSWNDGGIYQKMLQCSTGLSTLDSREKDHSGKLRVVQELMEERQHPTILFCAYVNTAEALARLMGKMKRRVAVVSSRYSMGQRQAAVRAFRAGNIDVLVGTVGTLSEGVTLTQADTCIFVERSPRPVTNDQARRRIRRFGQERPTLSIDLITEDSVDERLMELLETKSEEIELALTGFQLAALGGGS